MIAPWEVPDLPGEWLEGAQAITTGVTRAIKVQKIIDQRLAAWRANHQGYNRKM